MDLCMFCDEPATRLCDAVIALVAGDWVKSKGGDLHPVVTMDAMLSISYTCDAPFCCNHGRAVGHVCGDAPDTIDHCCGCVNADRHGARPIIDANSIPAMRRDWHAGYRRNRIKAMTRQPEGDSNG